MSWQSILHDNGAKNRLYKLFSLKTATLIKTSCAIHVLGIFIYLTLKFYQHWINPLPDIKILDRSELKQIVDGILKCI